MVHVFYFLDVSNISNSNCRLLKMTQEVGIVEAVEGSLDVSLYPIGSFLKIMPYHVSRVF